MLSTFKNMAAGCPWSSTLTGTRENLLEMLTDPSPTVIKATSLALARLSFLSVTHILQVGVTVESVLPEATELMGNQPFSQHKPWPRSSLCFILKAQPPKTIPSPVKGVKPVSETRESNLEVGSAQGSRWEKKNKKQKNLRQLRLRGRRHVHSTAWLERRP